MTDVFIGLAKGAEGLSIKDFTVGTSTGSTNIELRIADASNYSRLELLKALMAFQYAIVQHGLITNTDQKQGG